MNNNYCVIMCGGAGTRFWPVSRQKKPKQFLDFFGTGRSLIRMTYDRFTDFIPKENIFVVTNYSYRSLVSEQLPELSPSQILLEPCKRNTSACIAWASYHIRKRNPNANMVVVPSDHLILKEEEFIRLVKEGLEYVSNNSRLLTIGIVPQRAECGYGYIQKGPSIREEFYSVKTFTEKPNKEMAKIFFESGEFLWNSGMFLWNVKIILEEFEKYLPDIAGNFRFGEQYLCTDKEYNFINQNFPVLPNVSIDYGIMEKSERVDVLMGDFGWSDVGTWGSYYDLAEKDSDGNVVSNASALFYDSKRNIVSLPKGKVAIIEGLEGYIVAESENALLVCRLDNEQHIRQFSADIQLKFGDLFT